jgi:hypothetical protein
VGVRTSGVATRTCSTWLQMRARAAEAGLSGALSRGAFRGGRGGGTPEAGMAFCGLSLSNATIEGAGASELAESSFEGLRNGSWAPDEFGTPDPQSYLHKCQSDEELEAGGTVPEKTACYSI